MAAELDAMSRALKNGELELKEPVRLVDGEVEILVPSDESDKRYSAVDCLSVVVMEKFGIREVLGVDSDLADRFLVRPGPRPPKG